MEEKKTKKLSQTLRAYNSQMHETILLKFDMWGVEGSSRLHYENDLSSTREHGATYHVLVLPVNIFMEWRASFTWPHDTLPCVLITLGILHRILGFKPRIFVLS